MLVFASLHLPYTAITEASFSAMYLTLYEVAASMVNEDAPFTRPLLRLILALFPPSLCIMNSVPIKSNDAESVSLYDGYWPDALDSATVKNPVGINHSPVPLS